MALPPSIKEALMNKHTHLNLDARILIETLLNQQHSFKSIARHLGKDCTTISKEVKSHICFEKSGTYGRSFNDCRLAFLHQCSIHKICQHCTSSHNRYCWTCGRCFSSCDSYEKYVCPKLFRNAPNALWKNSFIKLPLLRRNTNRSEANPVPVSLSPRLNLNSLMMWCLLFSKRDSPFITLLFIMLMNL